MKRPLKLIILMVLILSFTSCSLPFNQTEKNSVLNIGVGSVKDSFNPFFAEKGENEILMTQIFETVQRTGKSNKLENLCGSITYEYLDGGKVKYTVSIDDDIRFSDGTFATIDDIIFYYYVLADASYDGPLNDWYLNDIQGLKAYYYDDKNYSDEIASIYSQTDDKSEQKKKIEEYISKNYSDGISVSDISGIKKINDHSCSIVFNSVNINSISQINPVIISKAVYGAGYVKGKASIIRKNGEIPVGSGPYCYSSKGEKTNSVVLKTNSYYHGANPGFKILKFVDLSILGLSAGEAIKEGKIDICDMLADNSAADVVNYSDCRCALSDCNYYYSLILNSKTLPINMRKGICCLINWSTEAKSQLEGYYTTLFSPISIRFGEYPENVTEPYYSYNEKEAMSYLEKEGYIKSKGFLASDNGEKISVSFCCISNGDIVAQLIAKSIESSLADSGIEVRTSFVPEKDYIKSLRSHSADIWFGPVYDESTCDLFERFNSLGECNYSCISNDEIDYFTAEIRTLTDYSLRKQKMTVALDKIMQLAIEYPLFQQKLITVFNINVIDADAIELDSDPEGCRYIIKNLKPVQ